MAYMSGRQRSAAPFSQKALCSPMVQTACICIYIHVHAYIYIETEYRRTHVCIVCIYILYICILWFILNGSTIYMLDCSSHAGLGEPGTWHAQTEASDNQAVAAGT